MGWAQQSRAGDQDPLYVTGKGLSAPGWAEMVLLGHGEAPGEHRTISSVYIEQHCQLRANQCAQGLSTWKPG